MPFHATPIDGVLIGGAVTALTTAAIEARRTHRDRVTRFSDARRDVYVRFLTFVSDAHDHADALREARRHAAEAEDRLAQAEGLLTKARANETVARLYVDDARTANEDAGRAASDARGAIAKAEAMGAEIVVQHAQLTDQMNTILLVAPPEVVGASRVLFFAVTNAAASDEAMKEVEAARRTFVTAARKDLGA